MTTSNLGLATYNTASGSATTFLVWRLAMDDASSNMSIIDNWVGSASGSIIALSANEIIDVNASQISANYYEATVSLISSYATNLKINLKTNAASTGAVTLNINGLGTKTLKKVDSTGTLVDLASGDIVSGAYGLFIYNGTYFVLIGALVGTSGSGTITGSYTGVSPITVTGSQISHAVSGVTSGSYNQIIVDAKGHVTAGSFITITSGSGGTTYSGSALITVSGSKISHNTSGVISGSYNQVIVDSYGHITSASFITITSGSGGGITGAYVYPSGSSTGSAIARYDGTSGSVIKSGTVFVDDNGNIINYNEKINTTSGCGTKNIDWSTGNIFEVTMTGTVTFTFSSLVAGKSITLLLIQDGSGSHIISWPTIKWSGGSAPTLTTTGSAIDVITLFVGSDGTTIYGFLAGLDMK
jgi:hypothetical protein